MELFSVACITCRAKLKVTHVSAIGQILACPKCGSMVPIDPPAGWKPPPATVPTSPPPPLPPPKPKAAPAAAAAAQTAVPSPSTDLEKPPAVADAAGSAPDTGYYRAEPVEALDDDPLLPPGYQLSAQQQAWRRRIVIVAGLAAGMIVSLGLWWSLPGKKSAVEKDPNSDQTSVNGSAGDGDADATNGAPTPSATTGVRTTTAADLTAAIAASTVAASPSGTAMPNNAPPPIATASASTISPPAPSATTVASLPPLVVPATPIASVPPISSSAPAIAAMPSPSAASVSPIPVLPLPTAMLPTATPPTATPPVAVAAAVDAQTKLSETIPKFSVDQPLRSSIDMVAGLAGVQVSYDWDSSGMKPSLLTERSAVAVDGASLGEILRQLLAPHQLRYTIVDGRVLIGGVQQIDDTPTTVEYAVDDLAPQPAQADELAVLTRWFVAPHSWDTAGGAGTIAVAGSKLSVSQTPAVQREIVEWLDRLRLARGKSAKDPAATLVTRAGRARSALDLPATMNFRPAAPLETVLAYLESACKVTITVDYPALAVQGVDAGEPVGVAAEKNSLDQVLSAVCDARGWAWRIIDERAFEITLRESLARRPYCEFYDARPLLTGDTTAAAVEARIRAQLADAGWRDDGGEGRIYFDAPSGRLIVWQHQTAQQRIEKLLADAVPPARAAVAPAVAPVAAPSGTRLQAASPPPVSTFTPRTP